MEILTCLCNMFCNFFFFFLKGYGEIPRCLTNLFQSEQGSVCWQLKSTYSKRRLEFHTNDTLPKTIFFRKQLLILYFEQYENVLRSTKEWNCD